MSTPNSQAPLNGGYDESLLATAPVATKAAKQEGYNVDLLDERRHYSTPPSRRTTDLEASRGPKEGQVSPLERGSSKQPFWRTRTGIIAIAVGAIIIVGAVVGGAVGGSVGKHHNNQSVGGGFAPTTSSDQPTGQQTQPTGQQTQPTSVPGGAGGQQQTGPAPPPSPDPARPPVVPTTTNGQQPADPAVTVV